MRPTTPAVAADLETLISGHMSVPGCVPARIDTSDFVMSGLRAAASANAITRRKILSDISDVLGCDRTELEFLFVEFAMPVATAHNYEVMVPDFQRELLAVAE